MALDHCIDWPRRESWGLVLGIASNSNVSLHLGGFCLFFFLNKGKRLFLSGKRCFISLTESSVIKTRSFLDQFNYTISSPYNWPPSSALPHLCSFSDVFSRYRFPSKCPFLVTRGQTKTFLESPRADLRVPSQGLSIPPVYPSWTRSCLSTARTAVQVNGPIGRAVPSRGARPTLDGCISPAAWALSVLASSERPLLGVCL